MALTELQKSRIAFHLDYFNPDYMLQITRDTLLLTLDENQELALVGNPANPDQVVFEGVDLCSVSSMLGKVEKAFQKLDTDVIEDSLFVAQAGSVALRGNELKNRQQVYRAMVESLAQLVGGTSNSGRVGNGG